MRGCRVSASRRDVLRFALSALAAPSVIAATAGAPRASATGMRLIDFAERQVSPEQIKTAGFDGALVYVS
ncbi:MAG TPA: twin-arginine translocation pathway signal, partial [Mycobacterium sp.]|nr:twin-arginine translocation pathway signal [Mycobacterium sp.]